MLMEKMRPGHADADTARGQPKPRSKSVGSKMRPSTLGTAPKVYRALNMNGSR